MFQVAPWKPCTENIFNSFSIRISKHCWINIPATHYSSVPLPKNLSFTRVVNASKYFDDIYTQEKMEVCNEILREYFICL
jgi:hypothetical protein